MKPVTGAATEAGAPAITARWGPVRRGLREEAAGHQNQAGAESGESKHFATGMGRRRESAAGRRQHPPRLSVEGFQRPLPGKSASPATASPAKTLAMKSALPLRALIVLLFVGTAGLAFASTEKPAASGPVPAPYTKTARFSKQYDPNLKPDREAFPTHLAPVRYPAKWRQWGQPAYAIVEFLVKDTGLPSEVQCTEATDRAFAKAAEQAIEGSVFFPAVKRQQGVCSKLVQRISFELHPPQPAPSAPPAATAEPAAQAPAPAAP